MTSEEQPLYGADIEPPDLNGTAVLAQRINAMHVKMVELEGRVDQLFVRIDVERMARWELMARIVSLETPDDDDTGASSR